MGVTVTNLIQGPGTLYKGEQYTGAYTQTPEPGDGAINSAPAASAWDDVGGTQDGVNLEIGREYAELEVDQIVDIPDRRLTKREFAIATNFAEATLENLALSSNELEATVTTGSGFKTFIPTTTTAATQPTYVPLIFDGFAPGQFRRRVIARRMLSVDPITIAYKKDAQTVLSGRFVGHYVSDSLAPYKVIDQTS
jgi:hypothetical protein